MESESHKYHLIRVNHDPQNLRKVEALSIPEDSSDKPIETGIENSNTECLVEDTEMELPRDCSEDFLGHIKTNL